MITTINQSNRWTQWGAVTIYAFLILLITSWDSWLYDSICHYDVCWFFTCGKAWMNGMVPYVDFSDSKGPLLWFIYGIGYLISPHNYLGIFLLSWIAYSAIFFTIGRIAQVLGCNWKESFLTIAISSIFLLGGAAHDEVRAEDFCLLFVFPVFYYLIKHFASTDTQKHLPHRASLVLGIAIGATLLIKFNFSAMLACFIPFFVWMMPHWHKTSVLKATLWLLIGFAIPVTPFILDFIIQGNLKAFIQEYFILTTITVKNLHLTPHDLLVVIKMRLMPFYLIAVVGSTICYTMRQRQAATIIALSFIWFLGITLMNAKSPFHYSSLAPFLVAGIPFIVKALPHRSKSAPMVIALACLCLIVTFSTVKRHYLFFHNQQDRKAFYYYSMLMTQIHKPTIIYLNCHERGYGILSEALPGCKYWGLQLGATQEMMDNPKDAVVKRMSDFVVAKEDDKASIALIERAGYHRYDFTDVGLPPYPHRRVIYCKSILDISKADIELTNLDILLKRFPLEGAAPSRH